MTAGAVISGAIFGDKMSPLSDSTNLGAAVGEADLFDHIKSMMYTTIPALVIALIIYAVMGFQFAGGVIDAEQIGIVLNGLTENFSISLLNFIPPIIVVILAVKRVPGLAVMIIASLIGAAFAMIFQGFSLAEMLNFMNYGYVSATGVEALDELLSRGGLQSMMWTISMILITLTFGGIIEHTRMTEVMLEKLMGVAKTQTSLIVVSHITTLFLILTVLSHYLTHVLTCRTYKHAYEQRGLHAKNVTRISEAWGTLPSSLIPWGPCGAYVYGLYGIFPTVYLPFAFYILATMAISLIFGIIGFSIAPYEPTEHEGR